MSKIELHQESSLFLDKKYSESPKEYSTNNESVLCEEKETTLLNNCHIIIINQRKDAFGNNITKGSKDKSSKHHISFIDQIKENELLCDIICVDTYKMFNRRLIGDITDKDSNCQICCKGICLPY